MTPQDAAQRPLDAALEAVEGMHGHFGMDGLHAHDDDWVHEPAPAEGLREAQRLLAEVDELLGGPTAVTAWEDARAYLAAPLLAALEITADGLHAHDDDWVHDAEAAAPPPAACDCYCHMQETQ